MNRSYLGLGSNVGNRLDNLTAATLELKKLSKTAVERVSSIYETKPFGITDQNDFFNAVVEISTEMNLSRLHEATKKIERILGREKTFRWGPRKIDIDILLFNDEVVEDENLTVPHRDLLNRDFVLLPLLEICREFTYPVDGRKIDSSFLNRLEKYVSVKKYSSKEFGDFLK